MPWRLIGFLVVLTLFLLFSGFNTHKVTIFLGPFGLPEIPVFAVIVFSYILGAFTILPFALIKSFKKIRQQRKEKKALEKTTKKQLSDTTQKQPLLAVKEEEEEKETTNGNATKIKQKKSKPKKK